MFNRKYYRFCLDVLENPDDLLEMFPVQITQRDGVLLRLRKHAAHERRGEVLLRVLELVQQLPRDSPQELRRGADAEHAAQPGQRGAQAHPLGCCCGEGEAGEGDEGGGLVGEGVVEDGEEGEVRGEVREGGVVGEEGRGEEELEDVEAGEDGEVEAEEGEEAELHVGDLVARVEAVAEQHKVGEGAQEHLLVLGGDPQRRDAQQLQRGQRDDGGGGEVGVDEVHGEEGGLVGAAELVGDLEQPVEQDAPHAGRDVLLVRQEPGAQRVVPQLVGAHHVVHGGRQLHPAGQHQRAPRRVRARHGQQVGGVVEEGEHVLQNGLGEGEQRGAAGERGGRNKEW